MRPSPIDGPTRGRLAQAPPALLVHGIFDSDRKMRRLQAALEAEGHPQVVRVRLTPRFGRAPIAHYARQLDAEARHALEATGASQVDVVGFSMGALVCRYWIQRLGGKQRTRRFVSLAGPHAGSLWAHLAPLPAARDMRPGSPLLRELAEDADPWGAVEVFAFWTPFDLMVLPGRSGRLAGARREASLPVASHPSMVRSPRILRAVVEALA